MSSNWAIYVAVAFLAVSAISYGGHITHAGVSTQASSHILANSTLPDAMVLDPDDLTSKDDDTRLNAIRMLRQNDPKLRLYDTMLLQAATGDPDPTVRAEAAIVLGSVYSKPQSINSTADRQLPEADVIHALITLLDDPEIRVDGSAARALVFFGSKARAAAPKILSMLDNQKFGAIDLSLGEALLAVDPSVESIKAFLQGEGSVSAKAAVLQSFSLNRNKDHVSLVAGYLTGDEPRLRAIAVLTLTRMRVRDPDLVAKIISLAGDKDADVRASVARSLVLLGTKDQARAVISQLANDPSPKVKAALIMTRHRVDASATQPTTRPTTMPTAQN